MNVTVANNPALWQWIRDVTRRAELTVPDNIVVGFFDGFFVTANTVQIEEGKRLTGNTLYLPLTYMALLDEAEAAAVIGHELGHFTGEDTQYSLRFVPLYAGMQNSLEQMANSSQGFSGLTASLLRPSLDMGLWFLQTFHEAVSDWARSVNMRRIIWVQKSHLQRRSRRRYCGYRCWMFRFPDFWGSFCMGV